MHKYEVTVSGAHAGTFELHCSHQDGGPVWASGPLTLSTSPTAMMDALMPGMLIHVECDDSECADASVIPKTWTVTLDGVIWAPRHGSDGLLGTAAAVTVTYLGWVEPAPAAREVSDQVIKAALQ